MSINCNLCGISIAPKIDFSANIDDFQFFCDRCRGSMTIYSKTQAKKKYLLDDTDFSKFKKVFTKSCKFSFYTFDDIKIMIYNRYGNMTNLQNLINAREEEKQGRENKNMYLQLIRQMQLQRAFDAEKLETKPHGNCYSYIHYGKPSLEEVIRRESDKIFSK